MKFLSKPLRFAVVLGLVVSAPAGFAVAAVGEVIVHAPRDTHPGVEVKSQVVSYADLNLAQLSGDEAVIGRIRTAAKKVCEPAPVKLNNLKDVSNYNACVDGALEGAIADLNSPSVRQVYDRTK